MSQQLRDALDLVARESVADVHLPDLATGAVRRRRRRQLRRVVAFGSVVALIALLVVTVTPGWSQLHRQLLPASGETRVGGHPEHIGWQWPVFDLPARPGPMAGLLSGPDRGLGWWVVRADGHRYRLHSSEFDDSRPALSADGRRLAYVAPDKNHLVVHDLVTGRRDVLDGIGEAGSPGPFDRGAIGLMGGTPNFWSPSGDVLAWNGFVGPRSGVVLVDARRGTARLIDATGLLAGWLPDGSGFVTVEIQTKEISTGTTMVSGVRVHRIDLRGRDSVTELRPNGDWPTAGTYDQWSWAVSPDGRTLLAAAEGLDSTERVPLRRFRIADGREIGPVPKIFDVAQSCSVGWVSAGTVSVAILDTDQRLSRVVVDLRTGRIRTATVVSSHVGDNVQCLEESHPALIGPPVDGGILGLSKAIWLWVLAALAVVAVTVVVRRRQRALLS